MLQLVFISKYLAALRADDICGAAVGVTADDISGAAAGADDISSEVCWCES